MAVMPGAAYRPMPYEKQLPQRSGPTTVILHTNGGGANLYGWFAREGNTICSHFQVFKDGRIEQYVDTAHEAYAQFAGNTFGISVETEDDGDPNTPWTAQQVAAIQSIIRWAGVPHRLAPVVGGGIGYHQQYKSWNESGHNCPGPVRVQQITTQIIPLSQSQTKPATPAQPEKEWYEMASLDPEVKKEIQQVVHDQLVARDVLTAQGKAYREFEYAMLNHRGGNGSLADFFKSVNPALDKQALAQAIISEFGKQAAAGDLHRITAWLQEAVKAALGDLPDGAPISTDDVANAVVSKLVAAVVGQAAANGGGN